MSAEILREAAKVLRERAAAATPGPWRDSTATDGMRYGALVADVPHPDRQDPAKGGWAWEDAYGGCLVGESLMAADRAFIATMHPGVGLALADWLEREVDYITSTWCRHYIAPDEAALRIARLILGGAS